VIRRLRRLGIVASVCALALGAIGCDQFNGGGWLQSSTGEEKATFAVHGKCEEAQDPLFGQVAVLYEGKLQYNDHGADVRFHGDVEPFFIEFQADSCKELARPKPPPGEGNTVVRFVGTYRPQPSGVPGEFTGTVADNGEPGFEGDTFSINVLTGQYAGYENTGPLQGGNTQVK